MTPQHDEYLWDAARYRYLARLAYRDSVDHAGNARWSLHLTGPGAADFGAAVDMAMAGATCALCAVVQPRPDEDYHVTILRLEELDGLYCACGDNACCHDTTHPHACAKGDCSGWRKREEEA